MGWWNASWETVEEETADSIKLQSVGIGPRITSYQCGCETADQALHLCRWHEGYDEGVARMKS